MGPLIILLLLLNFGPCLLNRLLAFIKQRLDTVQLMVLRQQYQGLPTLTKLTADAPCHPGHTLPLAAPVQQEVAREDRRPLSYSKKAGHEPTRSPWTPPAAVAGVFPLIWEDLAWTPALAIKPLPVPHTPQTPFIASLTRSSARERLPNKGLHQRSLEVARSSRGVF